ncbi:MAG: peptidylprolyl isomerase [Pseudomonadales bacterium]|nr:peptidylprolyl isomerase [Pseudomonadales bacterium]
MSSLIESNSVVSIHYILTDESGNVLDRTEADEPLVYLQGSESIISGLEDALMGKAPGDSLVVNVAPEEAYGEIFPELIEMVDRSAFQGIETIEVGASFESEGDDGSIETVTIKSVEGDEVIVDANHPLAGIPLTFKVDIVSVRKGTKEEIAHGHVH